MHADPLIATVVAALVLAFILGAFAHRLRFPVLAGYLLAGVALGPFTPGFVADQHLAQALSEMGIILLMFGVGLHFSIGELWQARTVAVPGAIGQIVVATALGAGLGLLLDWSLAGSIVFGLALSVASTVVMLRALSHRRLVETARGRIAIGWLIVEDLVMVLTLVMLPALSNLIGGDVPELETRIAIARWGVWGVLGITVAKVVTFVALMLIVGRRVVPWLFHWVAHSGSRELFRLAVPAVALGVAFGAALLFDVSFALGAFLAGVVLHESELSQRAAEESLPLRDAFSVLFFVSVGMLFDPMIVVSHPLPLLGTLAIILVGKTVAAYLIVRAFGRSNRTALTIAASLAQIGEFSFILVGLGTGLDLLPVEGRDLVLAGAILSILVNPLLFSIVDRFIPAEPAGAAVAQPEPVPELVPTTLSGHTVLIGFGRVGSVVSQGLVDAGEALLVVEDQPGALAAARQAGLEVLAGNAADPKVLACANLAGARQLLVAIPQGYEAGQVVAQARRINRTLPVIVRVHSRDEADHVMRLGATETIMAEWEVARGMLDRARPAPEPEPLAEPA